MINVSSDITILWHSKMPHILGKLLKNEDVHNYKEINKNNLKEQLRKRRAAPYCFQEKLRRRQHNESAKMAQADKENISCELNLQDYTEWMTNLPEHLQRTPLHNLAIPGSHDSFTNSMEPCNEFGPDCPTAVKDMCKLFGSTAKNIVHKWSVTQGLSLSKQLQAGVRYFDLRIAPGKDSEDELHCTHGLLSGVVEAHLQEIATFLEEHSKEVVLMDFNHFYKMSDGHHKKLYDTLVKLFGKKMCPYLEAAESRQNLNLKSLWEQEQQVIVIYQCEFGKNHRELWPGSTIRSPWANTCEVPKLLSFLEESYTYRQQGPLADLFYVSQAVLTPDFRYMMAHIMGNLHDGLAKKAVNPVISWMKKKEAGPGKINIVILDYVELCNFIPSVIELNNTIAAPKT